LAYTAVWLNRARTRRASSVQIFKVCSQNFQLPNSWRGYHYVNSLNLLTMFFNRYTSGAIKTLRYLQSRCFVRNPPCMVVFNRLKRSPATHRHMARSCAHNTTGRKPQPGSSLSLLLTLKRIWPTSAAQTDKHRRPASLLERIDKRRQTARIRGRSRSMPDHSRQKYIKHSMMLGLANRDNARPAGRKGPGTETTPGARRRRQRCGWSRGEGTATGLVRAGRERVVWADREGGGFFLRPPAAAPGKRAERSSW
jgi:hypothetical protein